MERSLSVGTRLTAGLVAGVAGGVVMALFLLGVQVAGGTELGTAVTRTFIFIASAVVGPSAGSLPAAVAVGIVLHFCVAVGWALGYVELTRTQPQLVRHPIISGVVFGLVVYCAMNVILLYAGLYHRPSPSGLATGLAANAIFYGIPVALVAGRLFPRA